ncbi:MAG: hypothetical protein J0I09_02940 [Sphingobacteriia bacterium]|nr:hypothetical protein [Sphingobacteriia bacterium]
MKKYLFTITAFLVLFLFSCNSGKDKAATNTPNTVKFSNTTISRLQNNQVCMVNNRFLNSVQIAVPINGKTYYGCCEGCVKTLNDDSSSRYIPDPFTGEEVDKAVAYIIGKPGTTEDVLYFKSEVNAKGYFDKYLKDK